MVARRGLPVLFNQTTLPHGLVAVWIKWSHLELLKERWNINRTNVLSFWAYNRAFDFVKVTMTDILPHSFCLLRIGSLFCLPPNFLFKKYFSVSYIQGILPQDRRWHCHISLLGSVFTAATHPGRRIYSWLGRRMSSLWSNRHGAIPSCSNVGALRYVLLSMVKEMKMAGIKLFSK